MQVNIVIPTYNEKENIILLIEEIFKVIPNVKIIIVDDDSPDMTWKLIEDYANPNVKLIRRMNVKGLATAIGEGVKQADGDVVGWLDADMCMPPASLHEMLKCVGDYDIVVGSRYVKGGADTRSYFRTITSRIINIFAGLLLGFDIKDYDSGFILLKREVFNKVPFPASGYGDYFIELIYKCKKAGFRIKEVPYVFRDRTMGGSKTTSNIYMFIKFGFGYFARIIRLRFLNNRSN